MWFPLEKREGEKGGGEGGVMEEERFVWSIWRTQVSTLKWIKLGREAGRELANMTGEKISNYPFGYFFIGMRVEGVWLLLVCLSKEIGG